MASPVSWLDLKLGFRMLVKYPGLTLVGGLGMAVAVAIGASFFDVTAAFLSAKLPFEEGERVVALEVRDLEASDEERRILRDFATWREELDSVEDLGFYRTVGRNLIVPGGSARPVTAAAMTASGFGVARVPPLLGRTLVEADERAGAPSVVVIGHDIWRTLLGADPGIVGREVRLGNTVHTVVGVMPEGFAFPRNHDVWIPVRTDPSTVGALQGPEISVFGRLGPGVSLERARTELATIGGQATAASPATHERLRPRVVPYTKQQLDPEDARGFRLVQILVLLLLVVVCVNVAVLVYARTVTRVGEIAIRSALGASRRRIVAQLFAEAFVLSLGAAAVGLAVAGMGLEWLEALIRQDDVLPFWVDLGLSPRTIAYALGLAILAAAIVGVVPALKATGRRLRAGLDEQGTAAGMRLGRTWTALIVAQVAVAVAVLPGGLFNAWDWSRYGFARAEIPAEEYLTARLAMDRETPAEGTEADERGLSARYGDRLGELQRRLEAEPRVSEVAFASPLPGSELPARVEVEDLSAPADSLAHYGVRTAHVSVGFLEAFDVPVLAGRSFRHGDVAAAAREDPGAAVTPVIVNRAFVQRVLGGGNAVGRRIRYAEVHSRQTGVPTPEDGRPTPWHEVVGVVSDALTVGIDPGETPVRLYHPAAPGQVHPMTAVVRIRGGEPAAFAPRLREIAADVDPTLQATEVLPFDEALRRMQKFFRLVALTIVLVTVSVLLLSAAGIHALMSFTVARRRKEIGIRAALGAHPRRLLGSIFARAAGQLGLGLALGMGAAALLENVVENFTGGKEAIVLPAAAGLMLAVGLVAALGPARRGLRIEPTEALRAE